MKPRVLIVDDSPTIRKVVSGILERNGYETVAAFDGQRAIEILEQSDVPFDVALVDFVMPRMNGFQFCRGLRERPALRDLPVVLMSARTEKIRDQFVQQTGAVGAISKPFTPQDLLEVVRASSTRQASEKTRAQPSRGPATGHGEVMLEGNLVHVPIGAVLQMLQVEQLSGVLYVTEGPRTIVLAMTDGLIDFAYAENAGSEFRLGRMLVEQGILTKEQIDVAVAHQSAAAPPMPPPQAAGVLGAGSSDKQKRPPMGSIPVEKILQESPAMAYRAPAQTLLDLVEVASDAPEPLPESVRRLTPPPPNPTGRPQPLLGDLLIAQGMITEAQLRGALAHQSSELTYEVIRWKRGTFRLRREPLPPLAQSIRLHLPVAHLVMEGFRRVDEWRVIEETVGSLEGVLQRDTVAMDPRALESLDKKERDLLALVDGERSIRDVLDASPMSRFEGCKILFQLLEVRFVRRKTSA